MLTDELVEHWPEHKADSLKLSEAAPSPAAAAEEPQVQAPPKSSKEALEFACDGYATSLAMSPAARRQLEEAERVTEQALARLKEIEGTIGAVCLVP